MNQALLPEMQNMMKIVDELKGLVKDFAQRHTHQKSMEELLAEEQAARMNSQDAYEKSVRESIAKEKAAKSSSLFRFIPDDSDDEDTLDILEFYKTSSSSSADITAVEIPSQTTAITPEVPTHSLIRGDEHLDTIPERESDEFIKSCVENLVPIQESHRELLIICVIFLPLLSVQTIILRLSQILMMIVHLMEKLSMRRHHFLIRMLTLLLKKSHTNLLTSIHFLWEMMMVSLILKPLWEKLTIF